MRQGNIDNGKGPRELSRILEKYSLPPDLLSLLTLQLYEVYTGCKQYLGYYDELFVPARNREEEEERLGDFLSKIVVLLEDIDYHASELRKQYNRFVPYIDPES